VEASLPEQIVDAIHDISGRHEDTRAVHAKGVVCEGTFTAAPAAAALTRAAHMQGAPVPATVRFSNGGGDPAANDSSKDGRGLAVKL
jgi:catalase